MTARMRPICCTKFFHQSHTKASWYHASCPASNFFPCHIPTHKNIICNLIHSEQNLTATVNLVNNKNVPCGSLSCTAFTLTALKHVTNNNRAIFHSLKCTTFIFTPIGYIQTLYLARLIRWICSNNFRQIKHERSAR